MKVCVLGSGSKGNCTCVFNDDTCLLIDEGLSSDRVEKFFKVFALSNKSLHILVTHSHIDHARGILAFVKKYKAIVHASGKTAMEIFTKYKVPLSAICSFENEEFFAGSFTVTPFEVSHDVACVGYTVSHNGKKMSYATDLGKISQKVVNNLKDSDLVVLEANHDEDMLYSNPNYPLVLKNRISSDKGHLCNAVTARVAVELANNGVKQIILAHLSEENNIPELAFSCVRDALTENGISENAVNIEVALQDRMSGLFDIR